MKKIFMGIILLFLLKGWGKVKVNPFISLIPKRPEKIKTVEKLLNIEGIKLEGVILGEEKACAIINGKVYKKGDIIEKYGVQIMNINKEGVDLKYNRKIYRIKIETKKEMR